MEYTSTLDTLDGFSNALATHSAHRIGAYAIVYPLVKVRQSRELLIVMNKAPRSV